MMENVHFQRKQWQIQDLGDEVECLGGVLLMDLGSVFPTAISKLQLNMLRLGLDQC